MEIDLDLLEGDGSARPDEEYHDGIQPNEIAAPATDQVKTFSMGAIRISLDNSDCVELVGSNAFEQGEASNAENSKINLDPLGDEDLQPEYLDDEYQVEFKDIQLNEAAMNIATMRNSLDNSSSSDCMIACAYIAEFENGNGNDGNANKLHE